jgi:hypothetical protein
MVPRPHLLSKHSRELHPRPSFIEVPFHDREVNWSLDVISSRYRVSPEFGGLVTLHGEGETDGKRRILFSSEDRQIRVSYSSRLARSLSEVHDQLGKQLIALIVHPPSHCRHHSRNQEIKWLAESLSILCDKVDGIEICVESRGTDKQGKVVRILPDDILLLQEEVNRLGAPISHCLDLAQSYVCFGISGILDMLNFFQKQKVRLTEIHASDVGKYSTGHPRVSMPIGSGLIDWKTCISRINNPSIRILIEVIGGFKPYLQSIDYLRNQVLLESN